MGWCFHVTMKSPLAMRSEHILMPSTPRKTCLIAMLMGAPSQGVTCSDQCHFFSPPLSPFPPSSLCFHPQSKTAFLSAAILPDQQFNSNDYLAMTISRLPTHSQTSSRNLRTQ
ncbi:unnamed protein product [Chondrus crispus]|uniref:Uncharacterized protein n=1 Tax=Chondrus crispus TaxID=2769 RepID=R7QC37_CHOCR|nr:unnamed protein product [Chondrus crispus]CDF36062.1 unnamed protein product [Chondrus crispus]|eukprot:XP_005715881.1 unnamed protein product [Chondrus crispus]